MPATRRPRRTSAIRALVGASTTGALALAMVFATAVTAAPQAVPTGGGGWRLAGVVVDPLGEPVSGASIALDGLEVARTGEDGTFGVTAGAGEHTIRISHPAYRELTRSVLPESEATELMFRMEWVSSVRESITVLGIRAGSDAPTTQLTVERAELEARSFGQDVPTLLQHTPSMTSYSDSGTGSNYSYFSLRGIQQTRINITLDGAPLNDPAEHALYFNNFHGFSTMVESVQIQRGVGTSSVGAPSYGGSVNFESVSPRTSGGGDLRLAAGAYDTRRASLGYGSGISRDGIHAFGRFSYASTDGYRDSSGSEHRTGFLNAGWQGNRSSLKLVGFAGNEKSQMAFLAVEPATLAENPRFNPLDEAERDDFDQQFGQLKYTSALGDSTLVTGSLYLNGASGWFRLWDDPVAQNDLLQFAIDQSFWGSMFTLSADSGAVSTTVGVHYNDFGGDHTLEIAGNRLYENTGSKRTANVFAKTEVRQGEWLFFGDLQVRWADFSYAGDIDLGPVDWLFVDPKAGIRRGLTDRLSVYASLGRAQREPSRADLLLGEDNASVPHDLEAVRPESVVDLELGLNLNTPRLALQANLYAMEFRDEIALTGELSAIGLPLRRNVEESYRRGLEVDLRWMPARGWSIVHSLNLSHNRIREWDQFYDVYDPGFAWIDSVPITYQDVPPLLSPEMVANLAVEWTRGDTSLALSGRYLAASQLDNTGLKDFRAPSYANIDLRVAFGLGRWWPGAGPTVSVFVNNLLDDADQYPSGYSYQYLNRDAGGRDTLDGIPFYYPQAARNVVVSLGFGL